VNQPERPPNRVHVRWAGEQRFDAGRPAGPAHRVDGKAVAGQSPVDALLSAFGACAAIDVVEILEKRRTPVERLTVEVVGTRVTTTPRRLRHVRLEFRIDGAGIERVHAERAIELSVEKYCSVRASLAPDIVIEKALVLNGERVTAESAAD
jgi:putative redox protein